MSPDLFRYFVINLSSTSVNRFNSGINYFELFSLSNLLIHLPFIPTFPLIHVALYLAFHKYADVPSLIHSIAQ